MSIVVFPNANNTGGSWLLPLLRDLDALQDYDYGSTTYVYLLHGQNDACRDSSLICGIPLVVDVSYFRCFNFFPFLSGCVVPNTFFFAYLGYRILRLDSSYHTRVTLRVFSFHYLDCSKLEGFSAVLSSDPCCSHGVKI